MNYEVGTARALDFPASTGAGRAGRAGLRRGGNSAAPEALS